METTTAKKFNTITIREWIKALKSGKYPKGEGSLRRNIYPSSSSYCCLGVGCEIASVPRDSSGYMFYGNSGWSLVPETLKDLNSALQGELIPGVIHINDSNSKWGPVIDFIEKNYDLDATIRLRVA